MSKLVWTQNMPDMYNPYISMHSQDLQQKWAV